MIEALTLALAKLGAPREDALKPAVVDGTVQIVDHRDRILAGIGVGECWLSPEVDQLFTS